VVGVARRSHDVDAEGRSNLDAEESAELQSPGYEVFIALLSILSIVNLVLLYTIDDESLTYVVLSMNIVVSVILFLDFCLRFWKAPSRKDYMLRKFGWADLLASVPLMQFKILRVFRLARVYRLLKEYGAGNVARTILRERAGSALLSLLFIAILVLEFGSVAMLGIEQDAEGANITSASDALWYTIVTISTVGYGDQYPVTNEGRILGTVIIIVGVGIFGTLTGWLANAFLSPRVDAAADGDDEDAGPSAGADGLGEPVDARLARLERLASLAASGVLTDDEVRAAKAEILSAG
jgi:voltage-gated potassium channel